MIVTPIEWSGQLGCDHVTNVARPTVLFARPKFSRDLADPSSPEHNGPDAAASPGLTQIAASLIL